MTLKIEINIDNDAFFKNEAEEVQRILLPIYVYTDNLINKNIDISHLKDLNGNTVGFVKLED